MRINPALRARAIKHRAVREERRRMTALGYRKHETDWEIHRGYAYRSIILDAVVSTDGKYVWTLIGEPISEPAEPEVAALPPRTLDGSGTKS